MAQDRAKFHQMGTSSLRRISTGPLIAIIALIWYGVFCSKVIFVTFVTSLHMTDAEKMSLPIVLPLLQVWYQLRLAIAGQTPCTYGGNSAMCVGRGLKTLQQSAARYVHIVSMLNARTSLFLIVRNVLHSFLTEALVLLPINITGVKAIYLLAQNVQFVKDPVGLQNVSQAYAVNGVEPRFTPPAVNRCRASAGLVCWRALCYHPRLSVFPA